MCGASRSVWWSSRMRDRKFLSFHPRLARRSGPFWGPGASTDALSGLPNRQEPAAGAACPGITAPNPDS